MGTLNLTQEELSAIVSSALRRFYCRPAYLLKRLRKLRSLRDLKHQVKEGSALIKNLFRL